MNCCNKEKQTTEPVKDCCCNLPVKKTIQILTTSEKPISEMSDEEWLNSTSKGCCG